MWNNFFGGLYTKQSLSSDFLVQRSNSNNTWHLLALFWHTHFGLERKTFKQNFLLPNPQKLELKKCSMAISWYFSGHLKETYFRVYKWIEHPVVCHESKGPPSDVPLWSISRQKMSSTFVAKWTWLNENNSVKTISKENIFTLVWFLHKIGMASILKWFCSWIYVYFSFHHWNPHLMF